MIDKELEERPDLMEKGIHERFDHIHRRDEEFEERLGLMEKRIHERLDHIHRRDKRIENYLAALLGLTILLIGLVLCVGIKLVEGGFPVGYGLRLLPELYAHLNPMPFEAAAQMAQDLAEDLRRAGYTVTGCH